MCVCSGLPHPQQHMHHSCVSFVHQCVCVCACVCVRVCFAGKTSNVCQCVCVCVLLVNKHCVCDPLFAPPIYYVIVCVCVCVCVYVCAGLSLILELTRWASS